MSTDDLRSELEKREARKKKRADGAKKHGVSVGALLIAAFGAYEGYTNKEVAEIAATVAAEAKVDTSRDRADLVAAINKLKEEKAVLQAKLEAEQRLNQERYDQLREWLKNLSRRAGSSSLPASARREILTPPPPEPRPVDRLPEKRPEEPEQYQMQVQEVLMEKGLKK